MSLADELQKLHELHRAGAINDAELAQAKARLLQGPTGAPALPRAAASPEEQTRLWAASLHLSVLAGHVLPVVGWVVPLGVWQLKKADLPGLDVHGRNAANWIMTQAVGAGACVLIALVLLFAPDSFMNSHRFDCSDFILLLLLFGLLALLGVGGVVCPIIAAGKARAGEAWRYPAYPFLK